MLKNEWIEMMEQDLQTDTSNTIGGKQAVLKTAKELLKTYPDSTEIEHDLTVEKIYNNMVAEARKRAKGGFYDFTPHVNDFLIEQLKLSKNQNKKQTAKTNDFVNNDFVNLEDFL